MTRFARFLLILSLATLPLLAEDAKELTLPDSAAKDVKIAQLQLEKAALIQENLKIQFDAMISANEEWKKATAAVTAARTEKDEAVKAACKELKVDCARYDLAADLKKLVLKPPTVAAK